MERISSASQRVSEYYWSKVSTQVSASLTVLVQLFLSSTLSDSPAPPGGAEPAPLGRHDGAGRGRPHVLRAGQGDGSASQLPRLRLLPPAGPGPRGLPGIPGNVARHQPEGGWLLSRRCLTKPFSLPANRLWFSLPGRRDVPELAVHL